MKLLKNSLVIVLCFILLCSFFTSCKKKDNDETVSINYSTNDISFVDENGDAVYRIVRAEGDEELSVHASAVIKAIKSKYDVATRNVSDSENADGFAEIVIGDTNREITKIAKQALLQETTGRKDDYIICSIDDDIAIYGLTVESTVAAIKYFAETYITGEVITGGIHYINKSGSEYIDISIAGNTKLSDFKLVTPIYNTSYITELQITELLNTISTKAGYIVSRLDDNIASTTGNNTDGSGTLTPTEANEYEIIVGNATRDGVKVIKDYNAYEIRIEGKKVYLNGGSPYATAMAVSEFNKIVNSNTTISADNNVLNGDYSAVIDSYDRATYYRKTWGDDFDGTDINYDIWHVAWDTASSYAGAANGKDQFRGSSKYKNNYVKDGLMYQVAVEDENSYYGGWFDTERKMSFLYGYLELSTIHPKGMGFWTALWTVSQPQDFEEFEYALYASETDVEECYGPGTWAYGNTFAWPTDYGRGFLEIPKGTVGHVHVNNKVASKDDRGYYMDFHTFGFEWLDKTHVRFTADGKVYVDQQLREGAEQIAYEQPQVIRLSMACGSGGHGQPTTDPVEWTKYNKFIADWVHIYQLKGQKIYKYNENKLGKYKYEVVSE